MKLKFIIQDYQTQAVNSIVNIFNGQRLNKSNFTVSTGTIFSQGTGNYLDLLDDEILENIRTVQVENRLPRSTDIQGRNFTVEMETGTGKTYVYIKTILDMNKKYGFTKFIVVVPSIAIKEGVFKSFQITKEHFQSTYGNVPYNFFIYDSKKPNLVEGYATSTDIEIMIVTIGSFISDFGDNDKKSNLIYRQSEKLQGQKPIDLIKNTNPIIIIDEPQSVDNTDKAKNAIAALNPLCQIRYSATHREKYNLIYKLDPVSAYNQKLVKQISVASVYTEDSSNSAYIKLIDVSNNNGYKAKIELNTKSNTGVVSKKVHTLKTGECLFDYSNLEYYNDFIIDDIDCTGGEEYIQFANSKLLYVGETFGDIDDSELKRAQIKLTIDEHLKKERQYLKENIKVLSLFFIDEVSKYRQYDDQGNQVGGIYQKIFEEEYEKLINTKYKDLKEANKSNYYETDRVHDGYFSLDGKGRAKDTKGDTQADESIYNLIMKNKETLLSFGEPLRFIFSHSALKEGWDNPNVFQVCTLVETRDTLTKRQKIGRGLRICVDQEGNRVSDYKFNELTVIANESYEKFANDLQKELEEETGHKFGIVEKNLFADITFKNDNEEYEEVGYDKSEKVYNFLAENNIVTSNGKITDAGKSKIKYRQLDIPNDLKYIEQDIYARLDLVNTRLNIKDAQKEVIVKANKPIFLSEDFKELWDKICQKTIYSININVDDLINKCISDIDVMPDIKKIKIRSKRAKLAFEQSGVIASDVAEKEIGDISDVISYPDPIRYIQDETFLTRKTIYQILTNSSKTQSFLNNPQKYLEGICNIIKRNKKALIVDGIKYEKINDYYQQSLFESTELRAYLENNAIASEKSAFDYVVYDSEIEEYFAMAMEADDECKLYTKLPAWFTIDTPLGKHNPDWAIIMNKDGEDKLYFVVETKGSLEIEDRRGKENRKIDCARKHFEALGTGVEYKEAVNYIDDFKFNS